MSPTQESGRGVSLILTRWGARSPAVLLERRVSRPLERDATPTLAGAADSRSSGFSALEWSVIGLAKRDTVSSLAQPGRLTRAFGRLFGLSGPGHLADPRLESLRRLAVHAWRCGFALPMAEINRFLSQGFSEAQIETLVQSVAGLRTGNHIRRTLP